MNGKPGVIETLFKWTWKALDWASCIVSVPSLIFILPATELANLADRAKMRWRITRCNRRHKEITAANPDFVKAETIE